MRYFAYWSKSVQTLHAAIRKLTNRAGQDEVSRKQPKDPVNHDWSIRVFGRKIRSYIRGDSWPLGRATFLDMISRRSSSRADVRTIESTVAPAGCIAKRLASSSEIFNPSDMCFSQRSHYDSVFWFDVFGSLTWKCCETDEWELGLKGYLFVLKGIRPIPTWALNYMYLRNSLIWFFL